MGSNSVFDDLVDAYRKIGEMEEEIDSLREEIRIQDAAIATHEAEVTGWVDRAEKAEGDLGKAYLAIGRLKAKCAVMIAHLATLAREGDAERIQRVLKQADAESERVRLEDRVSVTLNAARSGEES